MLFLFLACFSTLPRYSFPVSLFPIIWHIQLTRRGRIFSSLIQHALKVLSKIVCYKLFESTKSLTPSLKNDTMSKMWILLRLKDFLAIKKLICSVASDCFINKVIKFFLWKSENNNNKRIVLRNSTTTVAFPWRAAKILKRIRNFPTRVFSTSNKLPQMS